MANTQEFCNSAKVEFFNGIHAFGTTNTRGGTGADAFKAALYLTSATIDKDTTAYGTTGEVTGSNYAAGGVSTGAFDAPALFTDTATTQPAASIVYSNVTLGTDFNAVLIYNDTVAGKPAISVHVFGDQQVTAGDFTLTMPTNNASTALLRIA